jgi:hypothetical protein
MVKPKPFFHQMGERKLQQSSAYLYVICPVQGVIIYPMEVL